MVDYLRLFFWALACFVLVPVCAISWIALFWLRSEERDEDDFTDEDPTLEYYV